MLIYFEDWLKTIEARPGLYEESEKQKMFIQSQIWKGHKNQCIYYHRTGI